MTSGMCRAGFWHAWSMPGRKVRCAGLSAASLLAHSARKNCKASLEIKPSRTPQLNDSKRQQQIPASDFILGFGEKGPFQNLWFGSAKAVAPSAGQIVKDNFCGTE